MKKLLFILVVVCISSTGFAQQWKFGGGLTFGSEMSVTGDLGLGLNIRGDYSIDDNWCIDPGFTFVFPSSKYGVKLSAYQFNADAHYYFTEAGEFKFFGIGGLNYTHWKFKYDENWNNGVYSYGSYDSTHNEIGLNIGAGANFRQFFGELKYDTSFDQLALTVGIMFYLV